MLATHSLYAPAATNSVIPVCVKTSPAAVAVCCTYSYALAEGIVPGGDVVTGEDDKAVMQIFENWGKMGEGVIRFLSQTNLILPFGPRITLQNFITIESKLRP